MTQAPDPLGRATSELALDRAPPPPPGNQLILDFLLSRVPGGLPSLPFLDRERAWIGPDTTREPSLETPRIVGGWADALRPRGLGAGDRCLGCSRLGCGNVLDAGWPGEGLLLSALLPLRGGVAPVAVTAGIHGGVPSFVSTVGGGGGGEEGTAGAL